MTDPSPNRDTPDWLAPLRDLAFQLGFRKLGIAPAVESKGYSDLVRWIENGYAADMHYFSDRLDAYRHPESVLAGVRSILVLAYPYPAAAATKASESHGRVARFAWSGIDYHDTLHRHLKALKRLIQQHAPEIGVRGCVDTAPLMERELAEIAGVGWRGKNTLLLNRDLGSYFFLSCLLVDVKLPYDAPHTANHCGTCTACLDACPTDAFPAAGVLDASRCISYLTIEHREAMDESLRSDTADWVFGCDVCQEVCPWNRKVTRRDSTPPAERPMETLDLLSLFELDDEAFRQRFRKSPFWRTRRRGMLRNAAIVLGNQRNQAALDVLQRFARDSDPVVAEACCWASEQIEADKN